MFDCVIIPYLSDNVSLSLGTGKGGRLEEGGGKNGRGEGGRLEEGRMEDWKRGGWKIGRGEDRKWVVTEIGRICYA